MDENEKYVLIENYMFLKKNMNKFMKLLNQKEFQLKIRLY